MVSGGNVQVRGLGGNEQTRILVPHEELALEMAPFDGASLGAYDMKASVFFRVLLASGLGLGLLPLAPGTWAALLGVACHLAIATISSPALQTSLLVTCFLLVCAGNHLLTPWAQSYWGSKDPKHFVLDEIAGYLLIPIVFHHGQPWQIALWGFLGFRLLDIIKLPPASQIDRQGTGAWAILMDDIISSLYTVVGLYCLRWISSALGLQRWLIS